MTLLYLEITQPDLQREYHLARSIPAIWSPPRQRSLVVLVSRRSA